MKAWPVLCCALLSSCAAPVQHHYATVPADMIPAKPVLPTIPKEAFSCLPVETRRALLERDRLRKNYAEELRVLLESPPEK